MIDEKWFDLKDNIQDKFNVLEDKTEDLILEVGPEKERIKRGTVDILIFEGPQGKIKIERENKPIVLDQKIQYHRKKEGSKTEYTFSETEFSHIIKAYKWDEDENDWVKIDISGFSA